MVGETHIFSALRVLLYSPQLPHERHFCLAVKYIALHLFLMRFALLFSFCRKTLNLSARLRFYSLKVDGKLKRICKRAIMKWEGRSRRLKI